MCFSLAFSAANVAFQFSALLFLYARGKGVLEKWIPGNRFFNAWNSDIRFLPFLLTTFIVEFSEMLIHAYGDPVSPPRNQVHEDSIGEKCNKTNVTFTIFIFFAIASQPLWLSFALKSVDPNQQWSNFRRYKSMLCVPLHSEDDEEDTYLSNVESSRQTMAGMYSIYMWITGLLYFLFTIVQYDGYFMDKLVPYTDEAKSFHTYGTIKGKYTCTYKGSHTLLWIVRFPQHDWLPSYWFLVNMGWLLCAILPLGVIAGSEIIFIGIILWTGLWIGLGQQAMSMWCYTSALFHVGLICAPFIQFASMNQYKILSFLNYKVNDRSHYDAQPAKKNTEGAAAPARPTFLSI